MLATAQCDALDGGIRDVARVTERRCALTRQVLPVTALVRFVVAPDGTVLPDVRRKLPGRGLWITGSRAAVAEAVRRNVFARGFGREVKVADDLAQETERQMERAALDALAIAGKAGRVLTGASAVEMALGRDGRRPTQTRCRFAAQRQRKIAGNSGHRAVFRCAIGFGIEPAKCGTCSPACRAWQRDVYRSYRAFAVLSDRMPRPGPVKGTRVGGRRTRSGM